MLTESVDRIRNVLNALRARLWLIPALMSIAAVIAARTLVRWEAAGSWDGYGAWWYFAGDTDTAREVLSTMLSGMITMTSLIISITMVVLTLAATQLGPRLIWNFVRDRQIQTIFGVFFATIFFILVVSSSIESEAEVPSAAVTASSALVGLCLFTLLFHVSKVARAIIADTEIDEVGARLLKQISELRPAREVRSGVNGGREPAYPHLARVSLRQSGYVQVIEYDRMVAHAARHDLRIDIKVRAGHFVLSDGDHVSVRHAGTLNEKEKKRIRDAVVVGTERTPTQDLEYSVRQLVEIAVRALSPGINDPYTAIGSVNRLGEAVDRLMDRAMPATVHTDEEGVIRVTAQTSTFDGVLDAAFNQIRQAAANRRDAAVLISMCSLFGQLGFVARTDAQVRSMHRHLDILARAAKDAISDSSDKHDFEAALDEAERRFTAR